MLGLSDEKKSVESVAVQLAVDASNSITAEAGLRLKPWFVALSSSPDVNLTLAEKIAADPEVLGVVPARRGGRRCPHHWTVLRQGRPGPTP